jgi:hypothetical protein
MKPHASSIAMSLLAQKLPPAFERTKQVYKSSVRVIAFVSSKPRASISRL